MLMSLEIQKENQKECGTEKVLKQIMTENCPNLAKAKTPQIQDDDESQME